MDIVGIDHFALRTEKLEETKDFFVETVGFTVGDRPPFDFPGYWLYTNGHPVVHLFSADEDGNLDAYVGARTNSDGTGPVDHLALRCKGLEDYKTKLDKLGIENNERVIPDQKIHQIFLQDPNGITVELIFPLDET